MLNLARQAKHLRRRQNVVRCPFLVRRLLRHAPLRFVVVKVPSSEFASREVRRSGPAQARLD
uniref:Uncharacterized protein n=1 Tax=uncultured marine virus TaxID=186617 RepID=A0A0F7L7C6_9VIRU|nr:hypothetical protein [uncultured marine virus]